MYKPHLRSCDIAESLNTTVKRDAVMRLLRHEYQSPERLPAIESCSFLEIVSAGAHGTSRSRLKLSKCGFHRHWIDLVAAEVVVVVIGSCPIKFQLSSLLALVAIITFRVVLSSQAPYNHFHASLFLLLLKSHHLSYKAARLRYWTFAFGSSILVKFHAVCDSLIAFRVDLPPSSHFAIAVRKLSSIHWARQQMRESDHEEGDG